jgi:hypothetical protein
MTYEPFSGGTAADAIDGRPGIRARSAAKLLSPRTFGAFFICLFNLALVLLVAPSSYGADNPIFDDLVNKGIEVSGPTLYKLAPPMMADGLDAAGQKRALEKVADEHHSVESLLRKSLVSPFVLKITDGDPAAGETKASKRINLFFIVYADLDKVSDEQFLKRQAESELKNEQNSQETKFVALSADELTARQISASPEERYLALDTNLFDRVRVTGTLHARQTRTADSVLVAMVLDSRFETDPKYPDAWRSLTRDDAGKLKIGERRPYRGVGAYIKATRLLEPAGAIFVESHIVFNEPADWFGGSNFLRSKLPILSQDAVRNLRRRVTPH